MYCTSAYSTFPNLSRGPLPSVSVHEVGPTACVNVWRGLELGSLEGSSGRVLDVERNTCSILYTDYILYMVWVLYMSQLGFSPNKVPLTAIACDSSSACHPSCALAFFHLFSSLYVGCPSLFGCVCILVLVNFALGWGEGMCCLGTSVWKSTFLYILHAFFCLLGGLGSFVSCMNNTWGFVFNLLIKHWNMLGLRYVLGLPYELLVEVVSLFFRGIAGHTRFIPMWWSHFCKKTCVIITLNFAFCL